jgi:two-component system, NtrC family, nitrogen regulation sensor histidine kinase NtrY
MVFSRFRIRCAVRVIVLAATLLAAVWLALGMGMYVTAALAVAAAAFQTWSLVRFVEETGSDIERFIESVRSSEFAPAFPYGEKNPPFDALHEAMNEALGRFQSSRTEREARLLSLQSVVQHAGIGLIAFLADGSVELANAEAKRLFGIPHLGNVHELETVHPHLAETLFRLEPGERAIVPAGDGESSQLSLSATAFTLEGKRMSLVSIHNIRDELDEKEMEAWQNLIRVLTHEIMNSITPIASLASTARTMLEKDVFPAGRSADPESIEDIRGAIRTIEERSRGLLRFVENYRTLTRIPEPRMRVFPVRELFERVRLLMRERTEGAGIAWSETVEPPSIEISADPELIEQVLINLVQNSIQALDGRTGGRIALDCGLEASGRTVIRVADNGPGIEPDVRERIFIPFFTTRREGSGIGLSLSRRIVSLHGGSITVQSEPDVETVFTVKL